MWHTFCSTVDKISKNESHNMCNRTKVFLAWIVRLLRMIPMFSVGENREEEGLDLKQWKIKSLNKITNLL